MQTLISLSSTARSAACRGGKRLSSSSAASARLIELEDKHGAHNYHPLPVVLEKGAAAPVKWRARVKHA